MNIKSSRTRERHETFISVTHHFADIPEFRDKIALQLNVREKKKNKKINDNRTLSRDYARVAIMRRKDKAERGLIQADDSPFYLPIWLSSITVEKVQGGFPYAKCYLSDRTPRGTRSYLNNASRVFLIVSSF